MIFAILNSSTGCWYRSLDHPGCTMQNTAMRRCATNKSLYSSADDGRGLVHAPLWVCRSHWKAATTNVAPSTINVFTDTSAGGCLSSNAGNIAPTKQNCNDLHDDIRPSSIVQQKQSVNEKSAQRRKHRALAVVIKSEPKIFVPPQTSFRGTRDGQNVISWRWSLPLHTNPVWWGSMHLISNYRDNRPTNTHTHTHTHTHSRYVPR